MRLVLFEPDIPQNTGAMLRLAACFGLGVDIVFPCGFIFDEPRMRRAGMDYLDSVEIAKHASWAGYCESRAAAAPNGTKGRRLLLLSTKAAMPYLDFAFAPDDSLLLGRESSGVPPEVRDAADASLTIPMRTGMRSLNVAMAAAIVAAEALRQVGFPGR